MLSKLYILSLLLFVILLVMLMHGCGHVDPYRVSGERLALGKRGANKAGDETVLAMQMIEAKSSGPLSVESPAFAAGQPIPPTYSAYGEDASPPLKWSQAPEGTQSFVVLMEDPDAAEPKPFVHWVLYNLPADARELRTGVPTQVRVADLGNPEQGKNSRGNVGYFGPKPPKGDPAHHYHFQVFALDQRLTVPLGATRADVVKAMTGHVLAKGEVVGTFAKAAD
jgi:Raf kinase inhibitor-like YbhB/YbcL family protein